MARRITSMLLVILLLAGIIPSAFAAEGTVENEDEIVVLASSGKTVTITVDRNRQIQWIGHSDAKLNLSYQDATGTTRGGYMTAVNVTKVDGVIAYCIEPCVEFGSTYTEDEATAAWMTQLTANQRSAIALAIAYGYPNTDHPAASDPGVAGDTSLEYPLRTDLWQNAERYAATQIIVWEIVTGKRSAVAPYTCTDDSLYTSFYRTSNPYGYRADWNTLRDTYQRISDSMAAHKTVPSFSSSNLSKAPTHQLNYNSSTGMYEITLTDTNQVLSGYDFKCSVDGVTVTRSGNTLQISATAEAAAKLNGATVSAAGTMLDIDPEKVVAVWAAQGAGQTAVTLKTSPDPVTAYFKLSAQATSEVLIKKTTNTGANLSGWQINLYTDAACTKKVSGSPFTTGADGTIKVTNLTPGTYYAKEVASSDPYWVSDTSVKTVVAEAGKTATVTFSNTHYGDLKVKKTAINGSAEGWKFEIYDSNGKLVETITTGADGYAYSKKLLPGKYTVKEIHDKDDTYWIYDAQVEKQAQVTAGNQTLVQYTNEQVGQVEIVKTTNTGANLGGWKINLYTDAGCTKLVAGSPFTTDSTGKIVVPNLKPGTYYAKEVASTDPYWTSDTEAKTVKVEAGKTAKMTFSNTHYGDLRIKKNAINGSAEGWKFQIYDANGNLVQTITTGADGYAYSRMLLPGKYTVKEIHDRDDTYWTYDATVVKQTQITAGQQAQVEYTNEQFGLLEFRKTTNTLNHLSGWKFQVKDANGKLIGEYTTDANGYACTGKLKPGRYYVQEVGSSDPYWICDVTSYPVDVTAGKTVGHSATNIELGKGTFHKTTNTGANLDGWEITVYEDVSCKKPISVITTDAKGYGELYLEPGTYYAKETGDTKGRFEDEYWEIDTRVQEFKIEAHKDTAVTFVNTHYGQGKVIKTMATDGSLEGWQFKITDASGKEIEGSPFVTDKHGNILTGNLLPGTYTVEELIPENSLYYCRTENPQTITVVQGKTVSVTFTNALRPGKIAIEKVDIKGDHLAGATFLLEWSQDGKTWKPVTYSASADVVLGGCSNINVKDGCLTTGKNGIAEWGNLYPGIRYRITEVEAPDGYLLLKGYAFEGELPVEDMTVSLTVVNSREFEIPATGSNGVTFMAMAQVLCFGLCMTMLLFQRKRT